MQFENNNFISVVEEKMCIPRFGVGVLVSSNKRFFITPERIINFFL